MKIISLLPSATEIVYALGLGDSLEAVTFECDHPAEVRTKPVVSNTALPQDRPMTPAEVDRRVREFMEGGQPIYALDRDLIRRIQPDVVLGLGGYVAFPGGMMASLLGRPLALHEQNAIPGLANRVLAGVSDKVMVAFPHALAKAEWTGNPVRADIAAIAAPEERFRERDGPLRLLVVGGSLGAQALNETVPRALALLGERPMVVHQSGEKHLESLRGHYAAAGVQGELIAFIDDMARRYAEADLVICRAGAVTIAELSAGGMASVLVPFPHAVDDHQTANARFLADRGAAILLPQAEFSAERLAGLIRGMDRATLLQMARNARALGKPDAARVVAERCMELAR